MAIFNSYVSLPEGTAYAVKISSSFPWWVHWYRKKKIDRRSCFGGFAHLLPDWQPMWCRWVFQISLLKKIWVYINYIIIRYDWCPQNNMGFKMFRDQDQNFPVTKGGCGFFFIHGHVGMGWMGLTSTTFWGQRFFVETIAMVNWSTETHRTGLGNDWKLRVLKKPWNMI